MVGGGWGFTMTGALITSIRISIVHCGQSAYERLLRTEFYGFSRRLPLGYERSSLWLQTPRRATLYFTLIRRPL